MIADASLGLNVGCFGCYCYGLSLVYSMTADYGLQLKSERFDLVLKATLGLLLVFETIFYFT